MDDDLNISAALSTIFKIIKQINKLISNGLLDRTGADSILGVLKKIDII
jgi:cysteinyl-tRNA synthetase